MSKKVDICDLCGKRWPEYHFKAIAKRTWCYTFYGCTTDKYDICEDCWDRLRKQARKNKYSCSYKKE